MSSPETQEIWTKSDVYHNSFLIPEDEALDKIVANSKANGLRDMAVSPAQGKFLNLLARSIGAKRILEVGTLGGYSTTWLARAVPEDGTVTTLEIDPKCVRVATENLTAVGLVHKVNIILGSAVETIETLSPTPAPFDLVFIDADKQGNATYFKHAKRLVRKGGVIIVDNVVQNGKVADPENKGDRVEGSRRFIQAIKGDSEVSATTISTVGEKGYDGFTFVLKL